MNKKKKKTKIKNKLFAPVRAFAWEQNAEKKHCDYEEGVTHGYTKLNSTQFTIFVVFFFLFHKILPINIRK